MTVEKKTDKNTAVLYLEGWMDTQNALLLAQALNELEDDITQLVIDMEKLEYIASAGLRQLVAAHKQMKGAMILRKPAPEVREVLKMTGLDKRLNIEA